MTGPDPLDALLARADHLDDAGFTDRVLARLPPRPGRARALVLLGFAAASAVAGVLMALGPASGLVAALASWTPLASPVPLGALAALGAALAAGAVAAFAE
ncbi:MAG TPA: hypothetical protein VLS93_06410 [Anaeromyxobacteraceae bacterium]|nr:hypothetical protein [Anaeromyxobacteraceae bacterium]